MLRMILAATLRWHRSQRGASSGTGRVGAMMIGEHVVYGFIINY